jgi:hypothetical protein
MVEFFLQYAGIPILIALAFLLVVFVVFVVRTKSPKFNQWMNEVWPNVTQRTTIVTVIVIVGFLWLFIGRP